MMQRHPLSSEPISRRIAQFNDVLSGKICAWAGKASSIYTGLQRYFKETCRGKVAAVAFFGLSAVFLPCTKTLAMGEAATVTLDSQFDLQVHQLHADQKNLLIWIPSIYGIRPGNTPFAEKIQREDIDYWIVDLHASYQARTGRYSYARFKPQHIQELIQHAVRLGWQNIVLGGEGHGAALAMRAARKWQIENPDNPVLKGFVFFHPHLIDGQIPIGEEARFLPIARETNLPMYLFQPQHTIKSLHSEALLQQLESGGSDVYFHPIKGVRGGYHVRDVTRLYAREIEENERIGERIRKAVDLLVRLQPPRLAADPARESTPKKASGTSRRGNLVAIDRREPPPLRLHDGQGRLIDLMDHEGEVVLVNFWATWCGPCVKEIASLMRLTEHFEGKPFRVLTINIDEPMEQVAKFFDWLGYTPNFEVLFDPDGNAAKAWRVNAVPSTYLIDKQQMFRYAYRGALRWDKPSVIAVVQDLLE